ncbi:hypothetical protein SAMN05518849_101543 [Sphingobium sp. AP50]|uniref:phage tail tube protein n=1 Tax=Sphingobium sp. AP50 TaxID=1884369 RepID=UPI0008B8E27A|nr:phage tail tube protein [Sphingobium sp. AP50]SEI68243.1 hypothetical protein SAMN05518849_101543 [Sphingobium sp. AP50]
MSNANKGAEFWLHDTAEDELAKLAGVLSVTPSNPTRATYQDSDHDTVAAHTYQGEDLMEPGTLTVRINYLSGSATDTLLLAALADKAPRPYKSVHNAAASTKRKISGSVILTSYAVQDMPITGKQEAVLTFQASGAATHAVNS